MSDERPQKYIHIVWAPTSEGPVFIVAYEGSGFAHRHGMTMLGVHVSACELRTDLPDHVKEDIYQAEVEDFEDATPVDVDEVGLVPDRKP